jgi:predicted amidohydrolase
MFNHRELFLMGLSDYFGTTDQNLQFEKISDYVLNTLLVDLEKEFKNENILLVLGSGPVKASGKFYNAAPFFVNGQWSFQNKIYLTPWEDCFTPGEELKIFEFKMMKTAIVICFDIEQPYLAQKLKETGVHLVLSPSATTNKNGNQRVNRCASSRAVELGAAVLAVPLVGSSECDLVDYNEGRQGFFLPAQDDVIIEQEQFSIYSNKEHIVHTYDFDQQAILNLKNKSFETKPFLKKDPENLVIKT